MYEPISRELTMDLWNLPHALNELLEGRVAPRNATLTPRVDVCETEKDIRLFLDCPGLTKDSLSLTMEGHTLTVSGEKARPEGGEGTEWLQSERTYGNFSRSFTVSNHVDAGKISAHYRDGVLEIILEKNPEAQPRKITIEA